MTKEILIERIIKQELIIADTKQKIERIEVDFNRFKEMNNIEKCKYAKRDIKEAKKELEQDIKNLLGMIKELSEL